MIKNEEPKNIFEIVRSIRENLFFGKSFCAHENYNFLVVNKDNYKSIEMKKHGKENGGFPLIFFPPEQDSPKIHEHNALILKEFSSRFYILKNLKPGSYFIKSYKNINIDIDVDKTGLELVNEQDRQNIIHLNDAEYEFIKYFIKKYGKYSTPYICEDGNYKFNRPIMYFEKFFSFYIPRSNHELLKGLETNYI